MPYKSLTSEQILVMLAEAPPRIAALTTSLAPAQLLTGPGQGEWSAIGVLAHLRLCADVWGSYIELILAQDRPTIRAVKPTMWIEQKDNPNLEFQPSRHAFTKHKPTIRSKQTDYLEQKFQPSLQAFTTQRTNLLALLESLAPEDWSRAAIITGSGKPREETVFSYVRRLALHERPHVKQIERIVNMINMV